MDAKTCNLCNEDTPFSKYNAGGRSRDGKHSVCKRCHCLKERVICSLAKAEGMTHREWRKKYPVSERAAILNPAFTKALKKERGITVVIKEKVNCPILNEVRKRHKEARAKLNNKQTGLTDGFVYSVTNPVYPGVVKIGESYDWEKRNGDYQGYDPEERFEVRHARYFKNSRIMERKAHAILDDKRVRPKSEWFKITVEEAKEVIDNL